MDSDNFFILVRLDYSQVLDDAAQLQTFLRKQRFESENPKRSGAQKQKRILGKFANDAGEMSRQGQNIYTV